MKLEKSDALLLHSIVFAYVNSDVSLDFVDVQHLEDLQHRLSDYVTGSDATDPSSVPDSDDDDYEEEEDDYDEEDEEEDEETEEEEDAVEHDFYVSCQAAGDLSPVKVVTPDGNKVSMEFEDVGDSDTVDVLVDDGTVIIDSVEAVTLSSQTISVYDGEQWHRFAVRKAPKSWAKLFPLDKVVGFEGGGEEE